jgi:hypothetical protein
MDRKVLSISSIVISLMLGFFMLQQQRWLVTLSDTQLAVQGLLNEKDKWSRFVPCDMATRVETQGYNVDVDCDWKWDTFTKRLTNWLITYRNDSYKRVTTDNSKYCYIVTHAPKTLKNLVKYDSLEECEQSKF